MTETSRIPRMRIPVVSAESGYGGSVGVGVMLSNGVPVTVGAGGVGGVGVAALTEEKTRMFPTRRVIPRRTRRIMITCRGRWVVLMRSQV